MCVLHINLNTDNLDLILESTDLPIYQVYRKGENHKYKKGKVFETSLISCSISDKNWNDFEGQVQDMISFLEKYHTDLQNIKDKFDVQSWQFDLPYENRLSGETFNQNDFLPSELLFQSGQLGIGINLSLYHKSEQDVD